MPIYLLELLLGVRQAWCIALQYACCCDAYIHPTFPVTNRLPELPHRFLLSRYLGKDTDQSNRVQRTNLISHIDTDVFQPALSTRSLQSLRKLVHLRPLLPRRLG